MLGLLGGEEFDALSRRLGVTAPSARSRTRAMAAAGAVVALLALGWYAHMRAVDHSFRIEVCVRPFGRIRL